MTLIINSGPKRRPRRLAVLSVNADRFLDFLRWCGNGRPHVLDCELPADACVVGLTVDAVYNTVQMYVESETFPEVPAGQTPEEWDVTLIEVETK